MFDHPQAEHQWFDSLVGEWSFESQCEMGPDQPPHKTVGKAVYRKLGDLWLLGEITGQPTSDSPKMEGAPNDGQWQSLMTLGYDTQRQKYIGSFIASMSGKVWQYVGAVDEGGKILRLDTEGPKFDGSGTTPYQDLLEKVSDDHWILRSRFLGDDGQWNEFMQGHHRRLK